MLKTLSIIIPTYRRSEKLPQLLDSLAAQTFAPHEILLIDQNPEQQPPGWFESYACRLPLRIHFQSEPNASSARNVGFRLSTGEVVLFIDDDLVAAPTFCQRGMERLREFPSDVRCLCPVVMEGGRATAGEMIDQTSAGPAPQLVKLKNSITAAVFFEREYFRCTGGFDELLFRFARTAEDQEFFLRMLRRKMVIWRDCSLEIDHDGNVPGGCELRGGDYWRSRERCINSWALRYRIHGKVPGRLSVTDVFQLFRSAVLNSAVMKAGPGAIGRNLELLFNAIRKSATAFHGYDGRYQSVLSIDHLGLGDS